MFALLAEGITTIDPSTVASNITTALESVDWNSLATGWTVVIPLLAGPLAISYLCKSIWRFARKSMRSIGK